MKKTITRNEIKRNYSCVVSCGYCELQNIFRYIDRDFYNSGVSGWNYDVYTFENVAFTTGYRGMIGKRIPSEIIEHFDNIAREICKNSFSKSFAEIERELADNRIEFIREVKRLYHTF